MSEISDLVKNEMNAIGYDVAVAERPAADYLNKDGLEAAKRLRLWGDGLIHSLASPLPGWSPELGRLYELSLAGSHLAVQAIMAYLGVAENPLASKERLGVDAGKLPRLAELTEKVYDAAVGSLSKPISYTRDIIGFGGSENGYQLTQ